jgi:hypothetical protein
MVKMARKIFILEYLFTGADTKIRTRDLLITNPAFSLFIPFPYKWLRESKGNMGQSWDNYSSFWLEMYLC